MSDAWPGTPVGGSDTEWPGTPRSSPVAKNSAGTQQRGIIDKLLGLTGERYQTWPERTAREIGSLPQRFIESAGAAPPGTPQSVEAEVKPAFEAATLASPMGKVRTPLTVRGAGAAAPTQESLREIISSQYGELDKLGIQIPQKDVANLAEQIRQSLRADGYRPLNQPGTFAALDELEKALGKFADIDSVRKVLGNVRRDMLKNASDAKAAGIATGKIDEFLTSRAGETGAKASAVRGNVSALKKSEQVTARTEAAEQRAASSGSGANLANTLRQNIRWLVDPTHPERQMGFKPDEIALMKEIVSGGGRYSLENIARLVSKLGPEHPLSGWGTAMAADFGGGGGAALGTLALGKMAQWLSEKLPMRKIEKLDEMIRRRAPAAGDQPKGLRVSADPLMSLYASGSVPLIAGAPDRYQDQQMQRIKQDMSL